jgi:capsule polysaccharide export protein KpsE/RkpR
MFDALEFVEYIRRRWLTIAIACGVALGIALTASLTLPKRYTATATLIVQAPGENDPRASTAVSTVYLESLKSYASLASSDTLFARALTALHVSEGSDRASFSSVKNRVLKVTKPVNTAIIEISVTLGDPRKAQAVAQFIAEGTVELSRSLNDRSSNDLMAEFRSQLNDALLRYTKAKEARAAYVATQPIEDLENEIDENTRLRFDLESDLLTARTDLAEYGAHSPADNPAAQIASAKARIASLESQLRELRETIALKAGKLDERKFRRDALESDERSAQAAWAMAQARMNEMVSSAQFRGERLQIIDTGIVPDQPSSPNTSLNLAGALIFSLAGSLIWLVIRFSQARLADARAAQAFRVRALR